MLVLEPSMQSRSILLEALIDYKVVHASDAQEAIHVLSEDSAIGVVVMDMSLGGHSGMEFLYELRTYPDWSEVAVIVYSSVELSAEVLSSRAWQELGVLTYLYKPQSSLNELRAAVDKAI